MIYRFHAWLIDKGTTYSTLARREQMNTVSVSLTRWSRSKLLSAILRWRRQQVWLFILFIFFVKPWLSVGYNNCISGKKITFLFFSDMNIYTLGISHSAHLQKTRWDISSRLSNCTMSRLQMKHFGHSNCSIKKLSFTVDGVKTDCFLLTWCPQRRRSHRCTASLLRQTAPAGSGHYCLGC